MFDNIKLEKGLYNLSGKTFLQALEETDPSENYVGTPLEKLDAYERQLKRFDIKLNGDNCDKVEKFFSTTDTAILFPEYLQRCIQQGIEDSNISEIVAVKSIIDSNVYKGVDITDSATYSNPTGMGTVLPDSTIYETSTALDVQKIGRMINCPYEIIRQQKLNVLSLQLRIIGRKMGLGLYSKAIDELANVTSTVTTSTLTYNDLISLFGAFTTYDATTVIASPKVCADILKLSEISDSCHCNVNVNTNDIVLPFGAKLIKSTAMDDTKVIAIDKNFALEYVTSYCIRMKSDSIINRQLESIAVTLPYLFRVISNDAVKVLEIK
jgi:hypothetical protein